MNLFFIVGICAVGFIFMCIDSNKAKSRKRNKYRDSGNYEIDTKKLADVTKRMELLHQEQEIARVTNRFASTPGMRSSGNIRLNRNF